jgi:glycosyltransferase involved in cell wall biosynthesis
VELVFQRLAEGLVRRGCEVTVLTTKLPGTVKGEVRGGVQIRRVTVPPFLRRYFFTICSIPAAISLARHADIVHTTTYNGALPAWIASKVAGKPCVITVHEVLGSKWRQVDMGRVSHTLHRMFERWILKLPYARYICVSYATQNQLVALGIPTKKISVIYNGVDTDLFRSGASRSGTVREAAGLREQDFVFLYYGRPGVTKGAEVLVSAFHHVAAKHPHVRLMLMLTRSPRRRYVRLVRLIEQSPARERMVRLDPVSRDRVADVMSASDCVVVPSLTEGFGFAAAEAAAMGKPLVVSRTGSLPEVVHGQVIWTEPGSVEHLVSSLIKAVKGAYERVEPKRFSWDDMITKVRSLYESLINET